MPRIRITAVTPLWIGERYIGEGDTATLDVSAYVLAQLAHHSVTVLTPSPAPAPAPAPTSKEEALEELSRDDLRDQLRALGLPTGGTKDELIDRLLAAQGE